jgi:hypothetical protein
MFGPVRPPKPRKYPAYEVLEDGFSPYRIRKCFSCEKESRPRMTGMYAGILVFLTIFFAPLIYLLPWFTHGPRPEPAKLVAIGIYVTFFFALTHDRNGYRCRKCGGILI